MRFIRIVGDVFLHHPNDLNSGHPAGQADHPVLFRYAQQFIMHSEALSEAFNPTQTGGIVVDADRVFLPFTVSIVEQTSKKSLPDLLISARSDCAL